MISRQQRRTRLRRYVSSAGKWALVIAVLLLAWTGFLHLTRGTAVRHVQGVGADGAPVAVNEPEFPLSVTLLTDVWLTPGNAGDSIPVRSREPFRR
jgi:hypothetical protein